MRKLQPRMYLLKTSMTLVEVEKLTEFLKAQGFRHFSLSEAARDGRAMFHASPNAPVRSTHLLH